MHSFINILINLIKITNSFLSTRRKLNDYYYQMLIQFTMFKRLKLLTQLLSYT